MGEPIEMKRRSPEGRAEYLTGKLAEAIAARAVAERERDEARAEVERLRDVIDRINAFKALAVMQRGQAEAERDRRGDELRRAQAAIRAALDCHNEGDYDVCCGQATPCETVHALRDALEAPVPP